MRHDASVPEIAINRKLFFRVCYRPISAQMIKLKWLIRDNDNKVGDYRGITCTIARFCVINTIFVAIAASSMLVEENIVIIQLLRNLHEIATM